MDVKSLYTNIPNQEGHTGSKIRPRKIKQEFFNISDNFVFRINPDTKQFPIKR